MSVENSHSNSPPEVTSLFTLFFTSRETCPGDFNYVHGHGRIFIIILVITFIQVFSLFQKLDLSAGEATVLQSVLCVEKNWFRLKFWHYLKHEERYSSIVLLPPLLNSDCCSNVRAILIITRHNSQIEVAEMLAPNMREFSKLNLYNLTRFFSKKEMKFLDYLQLRFSVA